MVSDEEVLSFHERVSKLSYYQILSLPHRYATPQEVKRAFHELAVGYHPDQFLQADEQVRVAAKEVFKRAVEAYEVLRDATLQRRYVERYLKQGNLRLPPVEFGRSPGASEAPPARMAASPARAPSWVDDMQTEDGREVAEQIERMVQAGRLQQALNQLALLESLEPGNLAVKTKRNAVRRMLERQQG